MSRKLPALTQDSRSFWQGGAKNQLLIHFCPQCQRYFHPPGPVCPTCGDDEVGPKAVSGRGTIATFTINHQKWNPNIQVPYVIAMIELEEQSGLRLVSNITGTAPEDIYIGQTVQVRFEVIEDVWIPLFEVCKDV